MKNNALRVLTSFFLVTLLILSARIAEAKVYLDIVSSPRVMPIAITEFAGSYGPYISAIIKEDLQATGLFQQLDPRQFIEKPDQPFKRENWAPLGAEAVIKGDVQLAEQLVLSITLIDVVEDKIVFKKVYRSDKSLMRQIAHAAANEIYEKITGESAIFRTRIAYIAAKGNLKSLQIMDWDGQRAVPLEVYSNALLSPRWTPDGSGILFAAHRERRWGLYLLDLKSGKERLVFNSEGINLAGDFFPNGIEFTFSSSLNKTPDIYLYNIQKSSYERLTADNSIEVTPSVSPDGTKILFVSDRGGSPQIYIMDKNGYNKQRITFNGSYNTSPVWSPKGDRIAYSGRYQGKNQIYLAKFDGSDPVALTHEGNNEDPTFSPDSRFIAYTSDKEGKKAVFVMRSDGSSQRRISPAEFEATAPRWSPK